MSDNSVLNHNKSRNLLLLNDFRQRRQRRQGITQRRIRGKKAEKIKEEENIVRWNFEEKPKETIAIINTQKN